MTTKERLRELVESLDEEAAERVLMFAEAELEAPQPLTAAERDSVLRALAQSEAKDYLPSEKVFAEYGLD